MANNGKFWRSTAVMIVLIMAPSIVLHAQRMSLSTNALGIANMGTINGEVAYGFARRWTAVAGVRYNPFTFNNSKTQEPMQNRQLSYSIGIAFWPWHIHSGWWTSAKLRYQEYNIGGFRSPETREGDRFGAGFSLGYCHMLSEHVNIGMGIGFWGGRDIYTRYSCPRCGSILEKGRTMFILADDVMLSVAYVF